MTYGYNAKFRNFTGHQDIRSISTKLLAELVDLRTTEEVCPAPLDPLIVAGLADVSSRTGQEIRRPIVFVCHSLGGIIAKKALLLGCPEEQAKVQRAVYGIVFLGTPHNGSSIATCGKIIANIAAACSPINPAKVMFGALQKDSKVLFEITEDFVEKTSKLQLVSFFEMKTTSFGLFKKMVVEHRSAILNVPNEVAIGQNADHREMARFKSIHDRNFRPVLSRLSKFRQNLANKVHTLTHGRATMERSGYEDTLNLFELPASTCSTFHGRDDFLNAMDDYFHKKSSGNRGQLTFAICGLGGSGKTQTALRFAVRNRFRYRSGVIFFNASSHTTLVADFSRIHDLLNLGSTSDKVGSMKRWLSKKENSDWLLIFDNADDLDSVRISKYIPAASWGHIIITSRDQAAIGSVGKEGCLLERLEAKEAVAVLMEKAGIRSPSVEDYQEAEVIVELLGCLPLAVDQGGAFIRSRQKTLTDYRRLYQERQHEVLKFKPRLGEYDKTVLTAWEINFEQVERDSKEASQLLLLFCFLDPANISESMLSRGCSPQKRWSRQGEITDMAAEDAGLDRSLVALLKNEMDFDAAIERLLSFSLIHRNSDLNGSRSFSLHPLVQHCASQRVSAVVQDKWRLQAILLVCHAFPRSEYLQPSYGNLGRAQLPHVNRILKEYDRFTDSSLLTTPVKRELASMLLAASRFSSTTWKIEAMTLVKGLLQNDTDCYMHALAAHRESAILRMIGNQKDSNRTLEKFVHSTVFPGYDKGVEADARWNAQRGDLVVSFAENMVQDGLLAVARKELLEWNPMDPALPSTMERGVLRSRNINLGKILRYEGRFQEALPYLEDILRESVDDQFYQGAGWRRTLLSNIADLYCELHRAADAEDLLDPELKRITGIQSTSSGRRLQLSLTESFIQRGMYDEGTECLMKLKPIYESIPNPDIISSRGHFRVWTGLARIAHLRSQWDEALFRWREALKILETLGREKGFNSGLVRYSISHALLKLGKREESSATLSQAKIDLASEGRKYWIVGLNSYWFDFVAQCMSDKSNE
ncbi:MAG: hypothetical protein M1837_001679 [Sclerophora amabilis]|nr:MAG: hypothetical protein M1837_001679 [Sclerophora amabilis]